MEKQKLSTMLSEKSDQDTGRRNILLFVFVFFAVWVIRAVIYRYVDQSIDSVWLAAASSLFWKTLIWIGFPAFYLLHVEQQPPLEYLKLSAVKRKTIYWCIAVSLAGIAWQSALWLFKFDTHFPDLRGIVLAIWGAGVCEEILFRGFLLRKFAEFMSFTSAMMLTSILFAGAHIPGWLIFMNYSWRDIVSNGVYVLVLSIILSLLVKKSGSLYPSIIFHAIADIIAF